MRWPTQLRRGHEGLGLARAAIQYPITPEPSLFHAELPRLDSSMAGSDGLPRDILS